MKIYKVKVNGKVFEVELEEVVENDTPVSGSEALSTGEKTEVKSYIQGTVTDVLVKVNQKVKKGQALLAIEAMKMQNEIASPVDGTVVEILVDQHAKVQNQELLMVIA